MSLSSREEEALFEEWGWEKNLIQRRYEGPFGHEIGFDDVVGLTKDAEGEATLRTLVAMYGRQVLRGEAAP